MPYKDKEKAREYNRNRMRVARGDVVQPKDVQPRLLKRPNGPDYNPDEMLPDGRMRYLKLSDGQVHDRTTAPLQKLSENVGVEPGKHPVYGRRSVIFTPNCEGVAVFSKLASALDKNITGLAGKKENMLDLVRYGGISMRDIRDALNTKVC